MIKSWREVCVMSEAVEKLLPTLLALPERDRELIVEVMSESLAGHTDVDGEFLTKLNQRLDDITSGREQGIPGDEVMAEARRRYP